MLTRYSIRAPMIVETAQFVVYRTDTMANYRQIPSDEAMMWDEAAEGVTFSVLCELLAAFGGEDTAALHAASYLRGWVEAGMLSKAVASD